MRVVNEERVKAGRGKVKENKGSGRGWEAEENMEQLWMGGHDLVWD